MEEKNYIISDYIVINEELRDLLPALSKEEYQNLKESIRENGYDVTKGGRIHLWYCDDNMDTEDLDVIPPHLLVEGHHRWRACQELYEETGDIKYIPGNDCFEIMYFDDINEAKTWMIEYQLSRRNLSKYGIFEILFKNIDGLKLQAKKNQLAGKKLLANLPTGENGKKINVRDELAEMVGVGSRTVGKFMKVLESGNAEVMGQLRNGEISADAALKKITEKEKKNPPVEKTEVAEKMDAVATLEMVTITKEEYERLKDENDKLSAQITFIKGQLVQFKLIINDDGIIERVLGKRGRPMGSKNKPKTTDEKIIEMKQPA